MSDLPELIERLGKSTGPDTELDARIAGVDNGWTFVQLCGDRSIVFARKDGTHFTCRIHNGRYTKLRYTASLDAALVLVPDGFQAYVDTGGGPGWAHACVWTDQPHRIQGGAREMPTPAIALCLAALKSRAALAEISS